MNHPFMELWNQDSRLVVGLMSGTSADGVDAVLTRITGSGTNTRVEQLGFYFEPFDAATRQAILEKKRAQLVQELKRVQDSIDYIDWKQGFYADVLSGKTEYISNLLPREE